MPELKPCPFCGGEAYSITQFTGSFDELVAHHSVSCHGCGVVAFHEETEAEAIDAWNTRAYYEAELDALPMTEENMREYGWVRERTCHAEENSDASYGDCMFVCSECGADLDNEEFPNYCPQCGAKVVSE